MENDLISRSALLAEVEGAFNRHYEQSCYQFIHDFFRCAVKRIKNAPAVDAVDRKKLIKKLFPVGVPMTREEWNYSINARAVYEAIMKMEG